MFNHLKNNAEQQRNCLTCRIGISIMSASNHSTSHNIAQYWLDVIEPVPTALAEAQSERSINSPAHDEAVIEPIRVLSSFMFWTENTCVLLGDEAMNLSSSAFVLLPTPMEMIFTEESLSSLIGAVKVFFPPVLCPSVMMIST